MPVSAIAAIAVFGVLFLAWVVLPTVLKKRHANKAGGEVEAEE
ncbi:MAG: hypothetical protein WC370_10025 [Dehalococcoidales bacterium]|jgi:hypothetical protein